jgi:hypothetical protein
MQMFPVQHSELAPWHVPSLGTQQFDASQSSPLGHALVQLPQCSALVAVSTQALTSAQYSPTLHSFELDALLLLAELRVELLDELS